MREDAVKSKGGLMMDAWAGCEECVRVVKARGGRENRLGEVTVHESSSIIVIDLYTGDHYNGGN